MSDGNLGDCQVHESGTATHLTNGAVEAALSIRVAGLAEQREWMTL